MLKYPYNGVSNEKIFLSEKVFIKLSKSRQKISTKFKPIKGFLSQIAIILIIMNSKPKDCQAIGVTPIRPSIERIVSMKNQNRFVEIKSAPVLIEKVDKVSMMNYQNRLVYSRTSLSSNQQMINELRGGDNRFWTNILIIILILDYHVLGTEGFVHALLTAAKENVHFIDPSAPQPPTTPAIEKQISKRKDQFQMSSSQKYRYQQSQYLIDLTDDSPTPRELRFAEHALDRIYPPNDTGRTDLRAPFLQYEMKGMKHRHEFGLDYIDPKRLKRYNSKELDQINRGFKVRNETITPLQAKQHDDFAIKAALEYMNVVEKTIINSKETVWINGTFRLGDPKQQCHAVIGLWQKSPEVSYVLIAQKYPEGGGIPIIISAYQIPGITAKNILRTKNVQDTGLRGLQPGEILKLKRELVTPDFFDTKKELKVIDGKGDWMSDVLS